jgi:hypothetical protein
MNQQEGKDALITIALTIVSIVIRAFMISYLWLWYIVPSLHQPHLSPWQAVGVLFVVGCFRHSPGEVTATGILKNWIHWAIFFALAVLYHFVIFKG